MLAVVYITHPFAPLLGVRGRVEEQAQRVNMVDRDAQGRARGVPVI